MRWLSLNAEPLETRLPPNCVYTEVYGEVRCSRQTLTLASNQVEFSISTPSWASWDHRTAYISREVQLTYKTLTRSGQVSFCVGCSHTELGNSPRSPESQPHLFTSHKSWRSFLNTQSLSPCFRVFYRQNLPSSFVSLPILHWNHLGHS